MGNYAYNRRHVTLTKEYFCMFKLFSKSMTNALLIFGIIFSITACSGSSNTPAAAETDHPSHFRTG
jgi:hypothetical protein